MRGKGRVLDQRRGDNWIAFVGLAVLVAAIAACSGPEDGASSSESALAQTGRWALPSDVLLAGAKVHLTYDSAPWWTTTKACGGKLKPGGAVLGEYLMDHFTVISSVGGYSCRRNTADLARMSVHGTGRALDVFIPKTNGGANNAQGDKVANWLVKHAQTVGVQLVIWDRSVWRANGTNDAPYGGPVPHDDHIHVELTTEAAAKTKQWFADDGADGGPDTEDAADGATAPDAQRPPRDAAPPPPPDAAAEAAAPADPPPVTTPDSGAKEPPPPSADPSSAPESGGDEPGETNSLPGRPAASRSSELDSDPPLASSGCSAAPHSEDPSRTAGGALALSLALGAWLRRKRR